MRTIEQITHDLCNIRHSYIGDINDMFTCNKVKESFLRLIHEFYECGGSMLDKNMNQIINVDDVCVNVDKSGDTINIAVDRK